MSSHLIRDLAPGDFDRVVALNADEVQWTSPMNRERLEHLVSLAAYSKALVVESVVAGFLLAMANGSDYENDNFEWFSSRFGSFLYIDRIVIDKEFAGAGLGKAFYSDLFTHAREHSHERVVCEYNIEPLNAASQAFHTKMGFVEVGSRPLKGTEKVVSMQARVIRA